MKPKTAAFETTPERTAATSGGASVYAVRSQPWNGKSGALTAKASAKPRKIQLFPLVPESTRLNVCCEMPEGDDRREHQQRAGHRVDDEGDRRRDCRRGPPQTPTST